MVIMCFEQTLTHITLWTIFSLQMSFIEKPYDWNSQYESCAIFLLFCKAPTVFKILIFELLVSNWYLKRSPGGHPLLSSQSPGQLRSCPLAPATGVWTTPTVIAWGPFESPMLKNLISLFACPTCLSFLLFLFCFVDLRSYNDTPHILVYIKERF